MEVEFGLSFSAKGTVLMASTAGQATLKVKLTYRRGGGTDPVAPGEGEAQASDEDGEDDAAQAAQGPDGSGAAGVTAPAGRVGPAEQA